MKNQNDLIFSIVSIVLGLILVIVFWATAPQVTKPADPATVDVSTPKLPSGNVSFANSLPGGSTGGNGGAGGGMSMAAGMRMGAGGPGGGGRPAGGGPRSKN